jgi:hypothetical protein
MSSFELAKELFIESYFESKNFDLVNGLKAIIKLSKSRMSVNALYENTGEYIKKSNSRTGGFDPEPETIKLYTQHIKMYETGLARLRQLSPEQQEMIIVSGIVPETNLGYDAFTHGAKRTFKKVLYDYISRHLNINKSDDLTADVCLDIVASCVATNHNPPFVLFYRTHTYPKVRSVFGSGIIGKMIAAFMAACKRLADDKLWTRLIEDPDYAEEMYVQSTMEKEPHINVKDYIPRVGDWPWVAWLEWDTQFDLIRSTLSTVSDDVQVLGTDFSGYDQSMHYRDFEWILDIKTEFHNVYRWSLMQQKDAEVWTNGYRIGHAMEELGIGTVPDEGKIVEYGIQFKSGIWATSEFGSIKHYDLNQKVAKDMGAQIEHSILLSDDDLTAFRGFSNLHDHANILSSYGFEVSPEKTSMFSRDGYVEFLKNHIGYIYSDDELTVLGNIKSRIYGLAHTEREAEKKGSWNITGKVAVDQGTSKFASFGSSGAPFVSLGLKEVQGIDLGDDIIRAVVMVKTKEAKVGLYRPDLSISFRPEKSFENVDVPSILRP